MRLVDILEAPFRFAEWVGEGGFIFILPIGFLLIIMMAGSISNYYGPNGKNGTATGEIIIGLTESEPPYEMPPYEAYPLRSE